MPMYNIHCLNNISNKGIDLLSSDYTIIDDLSQASGILVRSAVMHDMQFASSLLAIARAGAGVNNIPLERCAEEGIVVFNTPGANANAVKEIVLCALFLGSRGILEGAQWCRNNATDENIVKSAEKAKKAYAGREILGKKLGVIGLGAIGAAVANAAIDLGMEVYGYDPFVSVNAAWKISSEVTHITNLDDIFKECDYITVHVPATPDTTGMFNKEAFDLMKPGTVVLNFSRDTLVNNEDMAAALASGTVGRYITDFAIPEVMSMINCVVLPHLGASTAEAEENCAMMAVRQLRDYIENGNITNSVNYPACDMGSIPAGYQRVAVLHNNVPNMISQITNLLGGAGLNIENLTNKARGEHAYTLIDVNGNVGDAEVQQLEGIEGVRRVRVIRPSV